MTKPTEEVVEIDAMDVAEWEKDRLTPLACDVKLAALVEQTTEQSKPVVAVASNAPAPRKTVARPAAAPPGAPASRNTPIPSVRSASRSSVPARPSHVGPIATARPSMPNAHRIADLPVEVTPLPPAPMVFAPPVVADAVPEAIVPFYAAAPQVAPAPVIAPVVTPLAALVLEAPPSPYIGSGVDELVTRTDTPIPEVEWQPPGTAPGTGSRAESIAPSTNLPPRRSRRPLVLVGGVIAGVVTAVVLSLVTGKHERPAAELAVAAPAPAPTLVAARAPTPPPAAAVPVAVAAVAPAVAHEVAPARPPEVVAPPIRPVAKNPSHQRGNPQPQRRIAQPHTKKVVLDYDTKAPPAVIKTDDAAVSSAREAYASGNQLLFAGDAEGAIREYRQALAFYPGYVAGYRGLGLAFAQQGDKAKALQALKQYVAAVPKAKDIPLIKKRIKKLQSK